jgi:nitroreductase
MPKMEGQNMDLMEAIKGRRSIRKYKSDPIPEHELQILLESIRWAPSWANTQCWEVIIIRDPEIKSQISKTLSPGNPATSSITEAPILIVLCGRKGLAGFRRGEVATVKGDWLMFDTGLAMQNLCLSAHSLGLGTVIIGAFDHKKVESILDVSSDVEVVAMTPIGYPASEGVVPKRKEISEFVFYEKYGKKK